MRIAVPITAPSMYEALKDMDEADYAKADIIELRIDHMDDPDLEKLLRHSSTPKIVTNRVKDEGGRFQGCEEDRVAYLQQAIDLGAEYVDIELDHFHPLDRKETKLIVSYHNFEKTPKNLRNIYDRIVEKDADIVKIATKAHSYADSIRMLKLIESSEKDTIGICMGPKGVMTRVLGPIYGSYLTFASLGKGKSSAPGQLSIDDLRSMYKTMQVDDKTKVLL